MFILTIFIFFGSDAVSEENYSIYDAQKELTEKGYNVGPIDGHHGRKNTTGSNEISKR